MSRPFDHSRSTGPHRAPLSWIRWQDRSPHSAPSIPDTTAPHRAESVEGIGVVARGSQTRSGLAQRGFPPCGSHVPERRIVRTPRQKQSAAQSSRFVHLRQLASQGLSIRPSRVLFPIRRERQNLRAPDPGHQHLANQQRGRRHVRPSMFGPRRETLRRSRAAPKSWISPLLEKLLLEKLLLEKLLLEKQLLEKQLLERESPRPYVCCSHRSN